MTIFQIWQVIDLQAEGLQLVGEQLPLVPCVPRNPYFIILTSLD